MNEDYVIKDCADLEAMFGSPKETVKQKVVSQLDDAMRDFVARSPLIFIASRDSNGLIDISPKGDAPGFVQVDHEMSILIPERPGNKLMFGFKNLLKDSRIGLIFVIPDTRETLRVKGMATLSRDPELLERLSANGKPALLVTHVAIEECFFHCGKAMIRSNLWKPETWNDDQGEVLRHFANTNQVSEDDVELSLAQSYRDKLY